MNINVQFPEITVQVVANEMDSVMDLKKRMTFFSEENEVLAFNGCLLSDEFELSSLGITEGSVISVISKTNKQINCRKAMLQSAALVTAAPAAPPVAGSQSSGGFVHYIGQALPSLFSSGGMIIAAGILSAGMIIAANIITGSERKQWLPSKDELGLMAQDFTPGSFSDLTDRNFEGAKNLFSDLVKHAHVSAHNCLKYISN